MNERERAWADLMRAAIAGDAAAYARLLKDLAPALRSTARRRFARVGLAVADAEDVVQETLLAIHLKRHTWNAAEPIGPWIWAIARNKLVDALRRRGNRVDIPIEQFMDVLPADDASAAMGSRDMERHLEALPPRQRQVLRAIAVDGASISDMAARLDMTPGAVRVALHRGLTALAAKFRRSE